MAEDVIKAVTDHISRLESKVDRMGDAIVSLARMEERMVTLFNRMDRYDAEQRDLLNRIGEIESITKGRGQLFRWLDRTAAAGVTAVAAMLAVEWWGGK